MKRLTAAIYLMLLAALSFASAQNTPVLDAAEQEMQRFMKELAGEPNPPYFIAYGITDEKAETMTASFGKLLAENSGHTRSLDIDLRVGSYEFDNTHIIRGNSFSFFSGTGTAKLPLGNDMAALKNAIWSATDRRYKKAVEKLEKAFTNKAVKVLEEDTSADFSEVVPQKEIEDAVRFSFNKAEWEQKIKRLSSIFFGNERLFAGNVSITAKLNTKYFVSTEGARLRWHEPYYRIFISAKAKAEDGMSLPLYKSWFSFTEEGLPGEAEIEKAIREIIQTLEDLREAPLAETYSGPAMLSGEASGVFFHEIFGHRVEGHRLKDPNNAQTFKKSLGKEVLPKFIDVVFDPKKKELAGKELSGYYKYDDEGVKSQTVQVVEDGIFKNFLMSRSPIENFPASNGHGRREPGYSAVSRQSNLIVESDNKKSVDELKEMLREMCREEEKEYGLFFVKVQGGFTFTGRTIPNSFNVNPLIVYKVYTDGRPDELVRGVDLIGTPLTTFSNIVATGDDMGVFNGMCGAESGSVPVSACSPTLLVSKIEVQKKKKSQAKLPILASPITEDSK